MTETVTTTPASVMPITPTKIPVVRFNIDQQCPIQYVTVYNDRAEVTRILRHHFDTEGTHELVLNGFSTFVDESSLHISGGTGKACTILEVSYQTRHEDVAPPSGLTSLDHLQSQLEIVQTEIDIHKRELARIMKQRVWLDGRSTKIMNQDGPYTTNDLENIQQFLEFYHKTLLKLDDATAHEEDEIKKLNDHQDALKAQINQHGTVAQANRRKTCREMTITVHIAISKIDVALEISYLISNCSWSASYDVRVSTVEANQQRTQLTYYGILGKPHKVTIGVLELTSTFTYTVVPKVSLHTYLKATTVNTSDKQLLAGPISVFMDNNFITHSSIGNVSIGDTFDLPLGTDASVKVEYKPIKKMVDTQGLISKVHHETIHHETYIINTKSTEITVFLYQQVPLSSDEKIKVKLITPDLRQKEYARNGTVKMNDRNNIEWKCVLQAHGEYRFPLEYTLEWPKEKRVECKEE
ncbi:unnamed protein product [Rotaria sp. Silwood2]|nr:unnamed protein product [Rotaria sp. Silwood2]CAF4457038.1 unnamed protein product [Rotaria sp. Silwood2]